MCSLLGSSVIYSMYICGCVLLNSPTVCVVCMNRGRVLPLGKGVAFRRVAKGRGGRWD